MKLWGVAFALAVMSVAPCQARSFGTAGGFDIVAKESDPDKANSGYCGMLEEYEGAGETRLILFRYLDKPDLVAVLIDNYNWSVKKDEEYRVEYILADSYYERTALGTEDSIHKGLIAFFPASDFLPRFARSGSLKVRKGDVMVDSLSLKGSGVAVDAFHRCWAYLRGDESAKQRERDRFAHIPKDPFRSGD
jgi:protein TonB